MKSDRGKYNNLNEYENFCEHGVSRQIIVSCTLEQNGLSKRRNQTLMEMARNMLK